MKKGLFFALLMVAVVAMAFPAAGRAPIIKDLPDIIIGDASDIDGGTTAARLYRYLNVLNVFQSNVIEWRNALTNNEKSVFMYRDTATETINIRLSKPTAFVNTLTSTEYTNLTASGTQPGAGTNVVDGATTFGFLSFMNMDIVTGTPTSAYTATPAANGVADASVPSSALGATDLVLAAVEVSDWPTTPDLVATQPFTVYTVHNSEDFTTGLLEVVRDDDFVPGSNNGWYGRTNFNLPGFSNAVSTIDGTTGGIGWDATSSPAAPGYGTWYLSDDGVTPKFLIPGTGMEDKVYRVRFHLTSTATTRATTCSYRMQAFSYQTGSTQGIQVLTDDATDTEASIDAPMASSPLDAEIHFAVPYELSEWGTNEALDNEPGNAQASDYRDMTLNFDGVDNSDQGILLMDSCVIESYPRPATAATPDLKYGTGGIAFNDAANGFFFPTVSGIPTLLALGTGTKDIDFVTLTMGAAPSNPAMIKWNQAGLDFALMTAAAKYPETAGELLRYTVECESATPDTCPNVRFQTTIVDSASSNDTDNTIYWNIFGGAVGGTGGLRDDIANSASVSLPGVPRTAAAGGSTLDLYRYIHNTAGTGRYLAFYWDCYGMGAPTPANGWGVLDGSFTVTSIELNGNLSNP